LFLAGRIDQLEGLLGQSTPDTIIIIYESQAEANPPPIKHRRLTHYSGHNA